MLFERSECWVQPNNIRSGINLVINTAVIVFANSRLILKVTLQQVAAVPACAELTMLASAQPLTGVNPQVRHQEALSACAEIAVVASVWLLTSVNPQVFRQADLMACAVATVLANVRLLASVNPQVCRQVAFSA